MPIAFIKVVSFLITRYKKGFKRARKLVLHLGMHGTGKRSLPKQLKNPPEKKRMTILRFSPKSVCVTFETISTVD